VPEASTNPRPRLLVVDDEAVQRLMVARVAALRGFETDGVATLEEAEARLRGASYEAVVLDLSLGERDGIELLRTVYRCPSEPAVIFISGFDQRVRQAAARLALALGLRVAGEIGKPLPLERLDMMLTCLPERTSRKQARLPEDLLPAELERGIENGEIQCLFQPKVRLADRAIVGLEVLTRWRSPTRGLVLPDAFIPLAEKSGLIDLLTHHILTQSLRVFRPWWVAAPELTLAVNLSPLSLTDLTLPERISRTLEASGMPPGQLVLEITEGSVTADYVSAADILTRLRIRGVRVSIDDFGTGYSSLLSLLRLPFNELKIDQSFVRGLCTDPEAAKIVRAVIRLAAELEVQLVAEGIETEEIAVKLAAIGCRIGQGYLFAPPLAASVLADRLAQGGGVDCPVEPPPTRAAVI